MQIKCPQCKTESLSENINLDNMLAKCHVCNSVFNFEEEINKPARKRREILLPEGMEMLKLGDELSIEVKWRKSSSSYLMIFTIIWNIIIIPIAIGVILSGELIVLLGMGLHLLVGISLGYYMITILLNTSYIIVDPFNLIVEHRPLKLPFYPNRSIPANQIDQVYVKKYSTGSTNGQTTWAYAVNGKLSNGDDISLVKRLKNGNHALFVEQEIEKHLKIKDVKVGEEWQG